jgi:hypothetical protein
MLPQPLDSQPIQTTAANQIADRIDHAKRTFLPQGRHLQLRKPETDTQSKHSHGKTEETSHASFRGRRFIPTTIQ